MDYVIAKVPDVYNQWKVSKFDGHDVPVAEYIVTREAQRWEERGERWVVWVYNCTCPKWYKKSTTFCKHTELVKEKVQEA